MYEQFYGFSELPFELTANPRYLFLTSTHREALSTLEYGLFSSKSITVMVGEAGTGKTTLIHTALESERCRHVRCIYVNNPALRTDDFVKLLALRFNLDSETSGSKTLFLERVEALLRERRAKSEVTALVVDEAQSLSVELLEEIRLLANMETPTAKLLPLVLAGQPELDLRLDDPSLRQLKQRVTLRCRLEPFDLADTAGYIARRLSAAGGVASQIFSREAVSLIHEYSHGIPRTISVICDNALVNGMALGQRQIDRALIIEVCRDLRLSPRNDRTTPLSARQGSTDRPDPRAGLEESVEPEPHVDPEPEQTAGPATLFSFRRKSRNNPRTLLSLRQ